MRATDLQRIYLRDAQQLLAGSGEEADWTLREWERVLDDLEADPYRAEDRLDWVAKRKLLETYIEAEGVWWEDAALRSLDLEYHNLEPEFGLFHALEEAGQMARLVTDEEIETARVRPPRETRAAVRGALVERFPERIERVSWGRVALRAEDGARWFYLPPEAPGDLIPRLRAAKTVAEAAAELSAWGPPKSGSGEENVPAEG